MTPLSDIDRSNRPSRSLASREAQPASAIADSS